MKKDNPLLRLRALGQSIWLDYLRRGMIVSGGLERFVEEDGVLGVTSNPAIFEKAIAGSHDYDAAVRALALEGKSLEEIYQALTVEDIQRAADIFRPIYDRLEGRDGFVSLEVSPRLAHDTEGTLAEARRLWAAVARPNIFIKVPATKEGIPAIRQLISEGINVNITLLFGLPRYREVVEAYLAGLEARAAQHQPIEQVASVASFFLSRIDVLVDPLLEKKMAGGRDAELAKTLHGQVAIASAKTAYQLYKQFFNAERFRRLANKGARTQRLLWASTSTKNPAYSDVKYVDALIGPATVNTVPEETLTAYRDHGNPASRLEESLAEAQHVLTRLPSLGIDLGAVTQQLEDEGVKKFDVAFGRLMNALKQARAAALEEPLDHQVFSLGEYDAALREQLAALEKRDVSARLWRKDSSLWRKSDPEAQEIIRNALGWLHVAGKMEENLDGLADFVVQIKAAGFRHVVDLGMGGSSLASLVFQHTFEPGENGLPLTVLDTTDPATVLEVARKVPLADTLFVIGSKSGTTAEPLAFGDYFYAKVKALKGEHAGENFVAVTDPGTPLVGLARERGFRRTFLNYPDIGGRYSGLSYFGLLPAALLGVDVGELLARTLRMVHACTASVPLPENPGVVLGAVLGELAGSGRDKVTFLMPPYLASLGMWLEQLLAESTGKQKTGLLPVAGEPIGEPSVYGQDRLFVYIHLKDEADPALERGVAALREVGQPVVAIQMDDLLDLGQEFFRWEVATAIAGAILDINPFDQPNVQESKDNTNHLLEAVHKQDQLPEERASLTEGPLRLYARSPASTAAETLAHFLAQTRPGDYVALMAYLTESPATEQALQAIRLRLRDSLHVATTLGYGPRFLHSTGQFHKGGPNTGLFLQLTADDAEDAAIPGRPYTFSTFKRAQALGDLEALRKHGRRVVRIDLGADVGQGLAALGEALDVALTRG
jgi:transaldolase/glucose-6-phosphate isomerase